MPRSRDKEIFVLITTMTRPITLSPCACARGKYYYIGPVWSKPELREALLDCHGSMIDDEICHHLATFGVMHWFILGSVFVVITIYCAKLLT